MAMPIPAGTAPKVKGSAFDAHLAQKVDHLVAVYGVNGLAALLGVSGSQPTRWRQRREAPSIVTARKILGLEYLTSRLAEVFTARQAQAWLASPNPFLAQATPAQVVRDFGVSAVEPAIAAVEVGAAV